MEPSLSSRQALEKKPLQRLPGLARTTARSCPGWQSISARKFTAFLRFVQSLFLPVQGKALSGQTDGRDQRNNLGAAELLRLRGGEHRRRTGRCEYFFLPSGLHHPERKASSLTPAGHT
jgi:hypothetical protein